MGLLRIPASRYWPLCFRWCYWAKKWIISWCSKERLGWEVYEPFVFFLAIFSDELRAQYLPKLPDKIIPTVCGMNQKQRPNVNQLDCVVLKCVLLWREDKRNGIYHGRWRTPLWKKKPREYHASIAQLEVCNARMQSAARSTQTHFNWKCKRWVLKHWFCASTSIAINN